MMSKQASNSLRFLAGGGTIGTMLRELQLPDCPLCPPSDWRAELKTAVSVMLNCTFPTFVIWGERHCLLYNDACIDLLQGKHPDALGRPVSRAWEEVWRQVRPLFDKRLPDRADHYENYSFTLGPDGVGKNTDPSFACTPIYLATGEVGGMYCAMSQPVLAMHSEPGADQEIKRLNQQLEQALQRALQEGQFRLHYQPQFDLQSDRMSGIEVLIRWQHPEKGLLAAAEFIRDAEKVSLTPPIGEWTLRTACRQHKKWVDAGLAVPLILNVSLRQLRHPRFLQTLRGILKETGLPPSMVQIEICEGILWDPKLSASLLKEMKSIGIQLALDDFGAELAALSSLQRFPLDVVKPGRRLVRELPHREQEAAVLTAVISVAHRMKMTVCAEGVETADQLAAVREHGCDAAQGFLFSSPVSESEMDRLVGAELSRYSYPV
jgi:EAL domain-containing protein (putative c-di-GMP-specific phosphodiesterase class I)